MSNDAQGSSEEGKQETNSIGEVIRTRVSDLEEDVAESRDDQTSLVEGENEGLGSGLHGSLVDKHEEVVCVEHEESLEIEAKDVKEISHYMDNETAKGSEVKVIDMTLELDHPKVTPVRRESNAAKVKKKPVAPTSKASQISTPRSSKPTLTPIKTFSSAPLTRRGNSPSISRRKINSTGDSKKVPSKSLHMSLSLAPSKPDPAPHTTMRKSLIMEKMADKDIVKRAFKTFQNHCNQPKTSGEDKSLVKEKVPSRGTEPRIKTSTASRKENGQSLKVDNTGKRNGNGVRTTLGLKSESRAEKGKESPRKVEEKFNAKEVERTHIQLKSKEEKQKHNFKATSLPALHRGQKVLSKSHPEKGNVKIEKWR
ncbi:hypothetical protein RJT34_01926 [Clitoria ternatea]|uniref:Uncharacterized protein n=1 Tax=Clitoria ternatea TaxID=43366 RepID=A0AAN9KJU4_CLITE